ncbi:MAG TPA: hypothetical protein VH987_03585 [Candidatus Limnocylindria bacterium]|jgi:hypothetical protein
MAATARAGAAALFFVLAGCATTSGTPSAPAPVGPVEVVGSEPILAAADLGDYGAILPSVYFMADGERHAYFIGFGEERGDQRAFHATSADGVDWTIDEEDPLAQLGLDLSPPGPIPGTVLQADDGTWVMYLGGLEAPLLRGGVIWRATSDSPAGPWVADPEPIVGLGERGEWDDLGIDFPAVVRTDEGWLMLYGGVGNADRESSSIGLATSEDGITWTKEPEPVLRPDLCAGPDGRVATLARLLPTDDGFLLLYDRGRETGAATSPDGRTWTCASREPILRAADVPGSEGIHTMAATLIDGKVSLLIESLIGQGGSELWLGELELP